jgi:hypothetical protein
MPGHFGRASAAKLCKAAIGAATLTLLVSSAQAEIDGHGPDAWRVTGVASHDVLNARMGPGANYPVLESFAHNERRMQQITCVPFYTAAHYTAMSEAQIKALPPRWCLMRDASMRKAGWVAQRFIIPDNAVAAPRVAENAPKPAAKQKKADFSDGMIAEAQAIVRTLYDAQTRSEKGKGADPLSRPSADKYFTSDIVAFFTSGQLQAHPLYGAQDFDGRIKRIAPDPDEPMLRGMVTINVDFTNFGQAQRAVYRLRSDTTKAKAPLRIFMVEHDGWSYP